MQPRFALVLIALFLASCSSTFRVSSTCELPETPPLEGVSPGEPLACHEVEGYRCCSWKWDGCLHTFCNSQFECAWEYRKGLRLDAKEEECPVPVGYTLVEVLVPDSLRGLSAPKPKLW